MQKNSNRAVYSIIILVVSFFIILIAFSMYAVKTLSRFGQNNEINFKRGDKIVKMAVVEVNGIILESKDTIEKLTIAKRNEEYKAIIVRVNSPGGAVGPSQEIYQEMIYIDKDEKKGKPVFVSFGSVAASGGYYIGAAGRKIYSNSGTLTGSIGVIMQFIDLSGLYKLAKISPNILKAGKYKDVGSPSRKMTPEEQKLMQKMLTGVHRQFIDDILATRGKKIIGNIKNYAQGQVFSGKEAKALGLVDHIAGLWEASRMIAKDLKLSGTVSLDFIKKKKGFSLEDILEGFEGMTKILGAKISREYTPMFLYRP